MQTWVCMVVMLALSSGGLNEQQQPHAGKRGPATLYTNYGPPPRSFEELLQATHLVVRGVVEGSHVRRATPDGPASVVTDHRLRVEEVLFDINKGSGQRVLHVLQPAGTLMVEGQQIVADPGGMPVLAEGQEVLLFLISWPRGGGFSITGGPAGLFVIDEGPIAIPSFLQELAGGNTKMSRLDFLSRVRARLVKR